MRGGPTSRLRGLWARLRRCPWRPAPSPPPSLAPHVGAWMSPGAHARLAGASPGAQQRGTVCSPAQGGPKGTLTETTGTSRLCQRHGVSRGSAFLGSGGLPWKTARPARHLCPRSGASVRRHALWPQLTPCSPSPASSGQAFSFI